MENKKYFCDSSFLNHEPNESDKRVAMKILGIVSLIILALTAYSYITVYSKCADIPIFVRVILSFAPPALIVLGIVELILILIYFAMLISMIHKKIDARKQSS